MSRTTKLSQLYYCLGLASFLVVTVINLVRIHSNENPSSNHEDSLEWQAHTLLGPLQLNRLNYILSSKVSKREIELVISRHREDISWSDMYTKIRTIYDKPGESNYSLSHTMTEGNVVGLENIGRESYTYLFHVVKNFNHLADVTVFTHGSAPTMGYRGHRVGGGHLLMNSTLHDFVLSQDGKFVFTGAVWLPSLAHIVRTGFNKGKITRENAQKMCPIPAFSEAGGSVYKFDLDDKPHIHVLKNMAARCEAERSLTCTGFDFWDKFIKLPRPPHDIVFFAQGATFAVTSEQIRRRTLQYYEDLLREVSYSSDPYAGFFLEWFWYYVFTSDTSPCPVSGDEFIWAEHEPIYKTLDLRQRVKYPRYVDAKLKKRHWLSKLV